jgi:AmiR/NasT family two-component response regulator
MRLIAFTGYGGADDIARATVAGFDAHLVKPVDIERLLAVLGGS